MSAPCKFELSILNHDEKALIKTSHHPEIGDADRAALENLKSSLRKLRDKERTLAFGRRRISKGTAEPRGQRFGDCRACSPPQAGFRGCPETG
jgi:hypothetical protein